MKVILSSSILISKRKLLKNNYDFSPQIVRIFQKKKSIKISETRREKKSEIRKMNKILSFAIIILMLASQQVWIINS